MVALGFQPVGADFPVFLHPQSHEEYALARTERKTARGYKGFQIYTTPDVTLEEDHARRDLTINAMAQDETGQLVDPYNGAEDLRAGVLRHVSEAFAEDPVRILRLARFAARFTKFTVAAETVALARRMVEAGEVDALVPERVWQELSRGLMEEKPSRMFGTARCACAQGHFPRSRCAVWRSATGPMASGNRYRRAHYASHRLRGCPGMVVACTLCRAHSRSRQRRYAGRIAA
jgi:tRNA nucleotidyltransferase (CCA-adding enzyme)